MIRRLLLTSAIAAFASLAGCSGSQPPIGVPGAMPRTVTIKPVGEIMDQVQPRPSYRVLYSFGRSRYDAGRPAASLIDLKGTLYGTTPVGGKYSGSSCPGFGGCGTVFSISTSGKEHVIYDFLGGADGYDADTSLIDVNGTLYGTTAAGGAYGGGTAFSITITGTNSVRYLLACPVVHRSPMACHRADR